MEFRIYKNKQEFFEDKAIVGATLEQLSALGVDVQKYLAFNTQNFAINFTDGSKSLLVFRIEQSNTALLGSVSLANAAANVVADYHLQVGACCGEKALTNAFEATYINRLGGNKRQALFAGGCFWCMAKPYYEYDGVIRVFSGYAGGNEVNPTYEQVKSGLTHHRETVMLEYDSAVITFRELLDIYFETIDPFDDSGQFIDRGENYTCAIYTDNAEEKQIVAEYVGELERRFHRKVQVKVLGDQVFYKAEEYHQDFALKNPEAMEEEMRTSGRLDSTAQKLNKTY